jgi:hypothetical protein
MILTPSKDIAASKEEHDLIRIPATKDKAAMELSFFLSFFFSSSRPRLESNSGTNNRSRRKSVARKDEKLGEMRSGRKTKQSGKRTRYVTGRATGTALGYIQPDITDRNEN